MYVRTEWYFFIEHMILLHIYKWFLKAFSMSISRVSILLRHLILKMIRFLLHITVLAICHIWSHVNLKFGGIFYCKIFIIKDYLWINIYTLIFIHFLTKVTIAILILTSSLLHLSLEHRYLNLFVFFIGW